MRREESLDTFRSELLTEDWKTAEEVNDNDTTYDSFKKYFDHFMIKQAVQRNNAKEN